MRVNLICEKRALPLRILYFMQTYLPKKRLKKIEHDPRQSGKCTTIFRFIAFYY